MKKVVLASVMAASFLSASAIAADPSATLVWQGFVPNKVTGDSLIITGLGGQENIAKGTLNVQADGTFNSDAIIVESHAYDSASEEIGDLTSSNWKLVSANLTMGSTDVTPATLEVSVNGAKVEVGGAIDGVDTLNTTVSQTTPLTDASGQAQVSVTYVASAAA
ncbi:hypothetical protein [Photobacterium damselae]|uniref:hypothetical protein n=1 Tax=Photobacterium damselae TaxID=38293 RepID=UPI00406759AE